jgi:hypothetical protein
VVAQEPPAQQMSADQWVEVRRLGAEVGQVHGDIAELRQVCERHEQRSWPAYMMMYAIMNVQLYIILFSWAVLASHRVVCTLVLATASVA